MKVELPHLSNQLRLEIYKRTLVILGYDGYIEGGLCSILFRVTSRELRLQYDPLMAIEHMPLLFTELKEHRPDGATNDDLWWPPNRRDIRKEVLEQIIAKLENS